MPADRVSTWFGALRKTASRESVLQSAAAFAEVLVADQVGPGNGISSGSVLVPVVTVEAVKTDGGFVPLVAQPAPWSSGLMAANSTPDKVRDVGGARIESGSSSSTSNPSTTSSCWRCRRRRRRPHRGQRRRRGRRGVAFVDIVTPMRATGVVATNATTSQALDAGGARMEDGDDVIHVAPLNARYARGMVAMNPTTAKLLGGSGARIEDIAGPARVADVGAVKATIGGARIASGYLVDGDGRDGDSGDDERVLDVDGARIVFGSVLAPVATIMAEQATKAAPASGPATVSFTSRSRRPDR